MDLLCSEQILNIHYYQISLQKLVVTSFLSLFLFSFEKLEIQEKYRKVKNKLTTVCPQYMAAAAKSLQSCLTLCNPVDGSPSGSPIPGIL